MMPETWKWERRHDDGSVPCWTLRGPRRVLCRWWEVPEGSPPPPEAASIASVPELQAENARLWTIVEAARCLLLAATGPIGGPTSWVVTRKHWLVEAAKEKP